MNNVKTKSPTELLHESASQMLAELRQITEIVVRDEHGGRMEFTKWRLARLDALVSRLDGVAV